MRYVAVCALIGLVCAGEAHANPTQDAATRFGLPGTWALNCAAPPSPDDEYAHWSLAAGGKLGEFYDDGPTLAHNRYRWDKAALVGSNMIVLDGVFFGNGLGQHVQIIKQGGRIRVLNSTDSSGRRLVVDGAFPGGGGGPSWFERCGSRP
jgi:hypothetical protein